VKLQGLIVRQPQSDFAICGAADGGIALDLGMA
jgi:hypothetical protein